jgi:hypothetical protein
MAMYMIVDRKARLNEDTVPELRFEDGNVGLLTCGSLANAPRDGMGGGRGLALALASGVCPKNDGIRRAWVH